MNPLNRILGHTIATLPDSLSERKELLGAALALMPSDHPLRLGVDEMLRWLIAHEQTQLSLALDFPKAQTEPAAPEPNDGNGDGPTIEPEPPNPNPNPEGK